LHPDWGRLLTVKSLTYFGALIYKTEKPAQAGGGDFQWFSFTIKMKQNITG
jgi:hypothetical protein